MEVPSPNGKKALQKEPKQLTEGHFANKRDLESHIRFFLFGTLILRQFNTQLSIN